MLCLLRCERECKERDQACRSASLEHSAHQSHVPLLFLWAVLFKSCSRCLVVPIAILLASSSNPTCIILTGCLLQGGERECKPDQASRTQNVSGTSGWDGSDADYLACYSLHQRPPASCIESLLYADCAAIFRFCDDSFGFESHGDPDDAILLRHYIYGKIFTTS
jgi:hypothetical protein